MIVLNAPLPARFVLHAPSRNLKFFNIFFDALFLVLTKKITEKNTATFQKYFSFVWWGVVLGVMTPAEILFHQEKYAFFYLGLGVPPKF